MKFGGSVSILGGFQKYKKIIDIIEKEKEKALKIAALEMRNIAIGLISENSDGPKQTRYRPKREVNVSPPGTPPNSDKGVLVQSIKFQKMNNNTYLVGTNLKYGKFLEFGTSDMAARPWLSVALKEVTPIYQELIEEAIQKGIEKAGQ